MKESEILTEKWKVHKFPTELFTGFYIGPIHGRTAIATYKTREAAVAALNMRIWLAREVKKIKRSK